MAKNTAPVWLYIVLALIAGLALGGLVFTWVRPFPGGVSAVPATTAPSTPGAASPASAVPAGQSSQPSTTLTPPPEDDQSQSHTTRRSPAKPASRPSPAAGISDAPPMTERPPIVTPPVPVSPPVTTPGPVPPPAPTAASSPSTAPYSPNRHRAVQETDAEAGLTMPSSPSGDPTGRPALTTRQSNNNSDSSGRPVLHRARNSEDTDSPSQSPIPQAPAPAVPSARPAYNGPTSGTATWTGKLEKNETLTINGGIPSVGILAGAGLPGVPVTITVDQTNLGFAEMPGASNNYNRLVLKSHAKHDKIVLHWTVIQ